MSETMDRFSMSSDRKTDKLMQNILQKLLDYYEDDSYEDLHSKMSEEYSQIDKRLEKYGGLEEINYMEMIVKEDACFMEEIEDLLVEYEITHGLLAVIMSHFWYVKHHGYDAWLALAHRTGLVTQWDGSGLKDSLTEEEKAEMGTWL